MKKFRFSDTVMTFPEIKENDNIELDSLENCYDIYDKENQHRETIKEKDEYGTSRQQKQHEEQSSEHLNLNGLCKDNNNDYIKNNEISGGGGDGGGECYLDEVVLPAESLQSFSDLKVLSLRSNGIQNFPNSVLKLTTLVTLDLSDNSLLTLPPEIHLLQYLAELVLDQNLLCVLPSTLWDLKYLKTLRVASNRLALPPDKFAEMRALILAETELKPENSSKTNGLTTLNLRSNRLKGNIILGNYGNLTELDVSENNIETLDLSAVQQLQVLQCSKNSLTNLSLHGKSLTSIIAGNNRIRTLTVIHAPTGLKHMDVSYNELESLPDWLSGCSELRSLFASNNNLNSLPDHLFCNEMPFLHTLQIAYNHLQYLPTLQRRLPIQEMFLQNNSLSSLPDNFFKFVPCIRVLNLSNNRLCDLPRPEENLRLEKLFLTANCLIDSSLTKISAYLRNLKILHAAYNGFTSLPEDCASHWLEIEELVLSGNKLLKLPDQVGFLKHLSILRVHSNLLQSIPKLSNLMSLRILDLAHNQLDRIDLGELIPPNLKFLDLSCNTKLHVDSQQFNNYRTQRPMSLVDVSGKNRTSLPLTPSPFCENVDLTESTWSVGFSETAGSKQRMYISQIRLPAFCNSEGLFGIFDGESNNNVPLGVDKIVPRILLEERTVKETAADYMKFTMLSAHRELKDKGQKHGLNAIICHILKMSSSPSQLQQQNNMEQYLFYNGGATATNSGRRYIMRIASVGDIRVVLGRAAGPVRLLPAKLRKPVKIHQLMVPDPDVTEVHLDEQDEIMIVANKNLWDVMTPETAIREVSLQRNVILAAKRLQDLAQSYGAEENLSIIVVKFNFMMMGVGNGDVDLLMRELRQTIKNNQYHGGSMAAAGAKDITACHSGCCCETLCSSERALDKTAIIPPSMMNTMITDDRSSPSGQSEHACSDCNSSARLFINQLNKHNNNTTNNNKNETSALRSVRSTNINNNSNGVHPSIFERSSETKISPERRSYRGVARALKARIIKEEEQQQQQQSNKNHNNSYSPSQHQQQNDSDSGLSEEQFKCWEYMLEQNTQLLFDKELNTLKTRSIRKPSSLKNQTLLSRSNPQLSSCWDASSQGSAGIFLSKQFGSARSFHPPSSSSLTTRSATTSKFGTTTSSSTLMIDNKKHQQQIIGGGPNAAYFGSLQRLMPYNLEYDFAVMHERGLADSIDLDRMQQYWGVTTTEL